MSYPQFSDYLAPNQYDPSKYSKYSIPQTQNKTQFILPKNDYHVIQYPQNLQYKPPNFQNQEIEIEDKGKGEVEVDNQDPESNLKESRSDTTQIILMSSESEEYKSDFELQDQESEEFNAEERPEETGNSFEKADQDEPPRFETFSSPLNVESGQSDKMDEESQKVAFLFDEMFGELTSLVTDIYRRKGLEPVQHEINIIRAILKERKEISQSKVPNHTALTISKILSSELAKASPENNYSPSQRYESQGTRFNLEINKNSQTVSPNCKPDLLSHDKNPSDKPERSQEQELNSQRFYSYIPQELIQGMKKEEVEESSEGHEERKFNEEKNQKQIQVQNYDFLTNKPQSDSIYITDSVKNYQKRFEQLTDEASAQSQGSHETVLNIESPKILPGSGSGFGLKNFGNTYLLNALLQCLCHLEEFSNQIIKIRRHDESPLIKSLAELFCKMKNRHLYRDSTQLDIKHQQLVEMLYNTRPDMFQANAQGDSSILFRVILEELTDGKEFNQLPQLQMFASGPLTKEFTCKNCGTIKISQEQMHILEVKDLNFLQNNQENFFQPPKEKRYCRCNRTQNDFTCHYLATEFPRVLAIKINDTIDSNIQVKILPRIYLPQSTGYKKPHKRIEYEFSSSVLIDNKGKDDFHSVALVRQQNTCYIYDDDQIKREINPKNASGRPQLLFYVQSTKN